ncbi:MAG: zinc ribbon domain-containing protein [Firmicutes bacterium]|nr:zinc ribbon domain-containing protein [Bacillota bacterium]
MTQYCTECGAVIEPGKKFCVSCGAKVEAAEPAVAEAPAAAVPSQPAPAAAVPSQPAPAAYSKPAEIPYVQLAKAPSPPPPAHVKEEPKFIGFFWSFGCLFLMNIPILGLVISLIWGFKRAPRNRSNLARAMIFINLIWLAVLVFAAISVHSVMHEIYVNTGTNFSILGFKLFK